jgi:hypothetical protein
VNTFAERRKVTSEKRGVEMLGLVMLLAVQGLVWFFIGYFSYKWLH